MVTVAVEIVVVTSLKFILNDLLAVELVALVIFISGGSIVATVLRGAVVEDVNVVFSPTLRE